MADEPSSLDATARHRSNSNTDLDENKKVNSENLSEDEDEIQKDSVQKVSDPKLQREVGLFSAILLLIGSTVGSGIFISPKGVLQYSGSVGASLLVWALCGVLAFMGALCYAELGTAIPVCGAEYSYFLHIYGPKGRFGPIPAFLFAWMSSLIIKPATVAIMLLTFAEYIVEPMFPSCTAPSMIKALIAIIGMIFITFVNCYSVKVATMMNNIVTVSKLLAITIVVSIGAYMLSQGHYHHLATGFKGSSTSFSDIARSFYFGLWAYEGWNDLAFMTEELINPSINLPRSAKIGIPMVTVCFVLTNISYLTVLSPDEVLTADAVAVEFANRTLGPAAFIIPILVAASAFGASNGTCLVSSRLIFAAAREGHSPELLSYIQVNHLTPILSLIFNGLIICLMICVGNISRLIDFFSFVAWMFYGGAMFSVIVMRYTEKDIPRPYKVPLVFPIVMSVISAYLVLAPLIFNPSLDYVYALIFLVSGLLFYIPFIHYGFRIQSMKPITHFVQLLLNCAPSERMRI